VEEMTKIVFSMLCLVVMVACAYQERAIIEEPTIPRVVIKEIPTDQGIKEEKEEYFESDLYPDLTKGYIENKAFPYVPEVWLLLAEGEKVPLIVGQAGEPPEFAKGERREYNLPPGRNFLHIYRWVYLPYYGGWQKLKKVEIAKVDVAKFPDTEDWREWRKSHYNWSVRIGQRRSAIRTGYVN